MFNPVLLCLACLGVAIGVMRFAVDHPLIENGLVGAWSALGVVYLLLWLRELRPARRIMRRGQRAEQDRAERRIDAMRRMPFIASVQYDSRTGRISGGLGGATYLAQTRRRSCHVAGEPSHAAATRDDLDRGTTRLEVRGCGRGVSPLVRPVRSTRAYDGPVDSRVQWGKQQGKHDFPGDSKSLAMNDLLYFLD